MELTAEGRALLRRIEERGRLRVGVKDEVTVEERREFRQERSKLILNEKLGKLGDTALEFVLRELIFDLAEKVDWSRVADAIEREFPELIPLEDELYSRDRKVPRRTYYLTDGYTVAKARKMSEGELLEANREAEELTGGTWRWTEKKPELDPRVVDGGGDCFDPEEVRGL